MSIKVTGSVNGYGLVAAESADFNSLRDIQVDVSGGSTGRGIRVVSNEGRRNVTLTNSRITVQGSSIAYGIYFDLGYEGQVKISNSQISASSNSSAYGLWSFGWADAIINHSEVTGATNTVYGFSTAQIGATRLEGGPVFASSAICAVVYDESYAFSAGPACP